MKILRILTITLIAILSGCANLSSPSYIEKPYLSDEKVEYWNNLVGTWKGGKKLKGGDLTEWIIDRKSDGTYRISFRTITNDGAVDVSTEYGQWGVSDNIYFTITDARLVGDSIEKTNRRNPYYYDAYRVVEATDSVFHIETIIGRDSFVVRKIADGEGFIDSANTHNKADH